MILTKIFNFSFVLIILVVLELSFSSIVLAQDRTYQDAEKSHVVILGYSRESWLSSSQENSWFYSGSVLRVEADTMLVATTIYSSGIIDLGSNRWRVGSTPEEYSLFVNFDSGIVLPVSKLALDLESRLVYLKVYIGDILTYGFDYVTLYDETRIDTGDQVFIAYFRPGQGRLRNILSVVNRAADRDAHDVWNLENMTLLESYTYENYNSGSPVIYCNSDTTSYYLQGLLGLRKENEQDDNIVLPIPSIDYINQLAWKDLNSRNIDEIRNLELLPL